MPDWYVLQVKTGEETRVRDLIKRDLPIKALVPQRMLKERKNGIWKHEIKTVFPGYVFVNTFMTPEIYYRLVNIPGVINILRGAADRPTPVPPEEMEVVIRLSGNGDPLGISEIFYDGSNVKVISGALQGLEGQIVKVDARRFRAKVNISLMGEPRVVELAVNVIEKIENSEHADSSQASSED